MEFLQVLGYIVTYIDNSCILLYYLNNLDSYLYHTNGMILWVKVIYVCHIPRGQKLQEDFYPCCAVAQTHVLEDDGGL